MLACEGTSSCMSPAVYCQQILGVKEVKSMWCQIKQTAGWLSAMAVHLRVSKTAVLHGELHNAHNALFAPNVAALEAQVHRGHHQLEAHVDYNIVMPIAIACMLCLPPRWLPCGFKYTQATNRRHSLIVTLLDYRTDTNFSKNSWPQENFSPILLSVSPIPY
jgi:hypothetical protein